MSEYKVTKQTEKKVLFAAPIKFDAPKFVATKGDYLIGVYETEEQAVDACANHASHSTRMEVARDLGHYPD